MVSFPIHRVWVMRRTRGQFGLSRSPASISFPMHTISRSRLWLRSAQLCYLLTDQCINYRNARMLVSTYQNARSMKVLGVRTKSQVGVLDCQRRGRKFKSLWWEGQVYFVARFPSLLASSQLLYNGSRPLGVHWPWIVCGKMKRWGRGQATRTHMPRLRKLTSLTCHTHECFSGDCSLMTVLFCSSA